MWVFSKTGFVSITDNPAKPDTFLVRARTRDDLESFARGYFTQDHLATEIVDSGDERDYRWRLVMPKAGVKRIIAKQLDDLDYTNVKDSIDKGDPKRHSALMGVWDSMLDLQEGGLYKPRWCPSHPASRMVRATKAVIQKPSDFTVYYCDAHAANYEVEGNDYEVVAL